MLQYLRRRCQGPLPSWSNARDLLARGWLGWVRPATHWFWPRVCRACHTPDAAGDALLCRDCRRQIGLLRRQPYCVRCGNTVGPHAAINPCFACARLQDLPPARAPGGVWGLVRVGAYGYPLNRLIANLKYHHAAELAPTLGSWLARRVGWAPVDVVTPVPLHPHRLASRGYNQAGLIARAVAADLDRPLASDLLRLRDTPPQTANNLQQRRVNVAGAFGIAPAANPRDRAYLLVDDVCTTGATSREAAAVLLGAGARSVTIAVVAVADAHLPSHHQIQGAGQSARPV